MSAPEKPRTFKEFPPEDICPVCGTNAPGECVLLAIDGTETGKNVPAKPTHLWCAVATNYNHNARVVYARTRE